MVQGDINQITSEYLILSPKISNLTFANRKCGIKISFHNYIIYTNVDLHRLIQILLPIVKHVMNILSENMFFCIDI